MRKFLGYARFLAHGHVCGCKFGVNWRTFHVHYLMMHLGLFVFQFVLFPPFYSHYRHSFTYQGGDGKKLCTWKKIAYPPPHPLGVACAKKAVAP